MHTFDMSKLMIMMGLLVTLAYSCDSSDGGGEAKGIANNCPDRAERCNEDHTIIELCSAGQWVIQDNCTAKGGTCSDQDSLIRCVYPADGDYEYVPPDGDTVESDTDDEVEMEEDGDLDVVDSDGEEEMEEEAEEEESGEDDELDEADSTDEPEQDALPCSGDGIVGCALNGNAWFCVDGGLVERSCLDWCNAACPSCENEPACCVADDPPYCTCDDSGNCGG